MGTVWKLGVLGSALIAVGCGSGGNNTGGSGGSGGSPPVAPSVTDMDPAEGPWGTVVSIQGEGLGSSARSGVELVLGGNGDLVIQPNDDPLDAVVSWNETEILFHVPFPIEGAISIETPQGAALAGEFTPSWIAGPSISAGPATKVISSVSPDEGVISVLLASGKLLEIGTDVVERDVNAGTADLETAKLYVTPSGDVEAIALSEGTPPELVHLAFDGAALTAAPTGITGTWLETHLTGGPNGGYAWVRDTTGWSRLSPSSGAWAIDKGPVADPAPANGLRAVAATNDGALHVVWNVETGDLFDDLEAPFMATLAPSASDFAGEKKAGNSLDDYLTVLELETRGAGMRLYWCGSDVDPVLGTPPESACDTLYISSGGTSVEPQFKEDDYSRFVFTDELVGAAFCGNSGGLELTTDSQQASGELAIWPCPRLIAVEIDPSGYFLPLIVHDDQLFSPRKRTP
jgi:hypothetical protein